MNSPLLSASTSDRLSPLNCSTNKLPRGLGHPALATANEMRTASNQLTAVLRARRSELEEHLLCVRRQLMENTSACAAEVSLTAQRLAEARVEVDSHLADLGPKLTSELHCLLLRAEEGCKRVVSASKDEHAAGKKGQQLSEVVLSTYAGLVASLQQRCTTSEAALQSAVVSARTYADLLSHVKGYVMAVMKERVAWQSKQGMNPCQLPSLEGLKDPFSLRCEQVLSCIKEADEDVARMGAAGGSLVLGDIINVGTVLSSNSSPFGTRPGSPRPLASHGVPNQRVVPLSEVRPHHATDTSQTAAAFYTQRLSKRHKEGMLDERKALYGDNALGYVYGNLGDRYIHGQRSKDGDVQRWVKPAEELALLKILLSTGNADHESFMETIETERTKMKNLKLSVGGAVRASCRDLRQSLLDMRHAIATFAKVDLPQMTSQMTSSAVDAFTSAVGEAVLQAAPMEVPEQQPTPRKSSRSPRKSLAVPATPVPLPPPPTLPPPKATSLQNHAAVQTVLAVLLNSATDTDGELTGVPGLNMPRAFPVSPRPPTREASPVNTPNKGAPRPVTPPQLSEGGSSTDGPPSTHTISPPCSHPSTPHPPGFGDLFAMYSAARQEFLSGQGLPPGSGGTCAGGFESDPFIERLAAMLGGLPSTLLSARHSPRSATTRVASVSSNPLRKPWGSPFSHVPIGRAPRVTQLDATHPLHNVLSSKTVASGFAPPLLTSPHCCCSQCPDNEACHVAAIEMQAQHQVLSTVSKESPIPDVDTTAVTLPLVSPIRHPLYDTSTSQVEIESPLRSTRRLANGASPAPVRLRQQADIDRRLQEALSITDRLAADLHTRTPPSPRQVATPPLSAYEAHGASLESTPCRTPRLPFKARRLVSASPRQPRGPTPQFVLRNPPSWDITQQQ